MFGWFKRKRKSPVRPPTPPITKVIPTLVSTVEVTQVRPKPAVAIPPATASSAATTVAVSLQPIQSSPAPRLSVAFATVRILAAQGHEPSNPRAGMPAVKLTAAKAHSMVIVGVQADGRRVLAKATDIGHVYAFTRRPDASYRLEGAPGRRGARLIIGATVAPA